MSNDRCIETLFKEHSFEEIESVRDNLAGEIDKRTELLKSIVKEKYKDIVETSDAIHSMKLNLHEIERSLWSLDKNISEFYNKINEPKIVSSEIIPNQTQSSPCNNGKPSGNSNDKDNNIIKRLLDYSSAIWENFDNGNLKMSVKLLNESKNLIEESHGNLPSSQVAVFNNIKITLDRAKDMIKNNLWHRIRMAAPDQFGIIAGSDQEDLYQLSLNSSMEFLVKELRESLSDTSYHAQIRRYQPYSYFNIQTNQVETDLNDSKALMAGYVQIPKEISLELNVFLYEVCKVINTIAGFNLNRSSIVDSLKTTAEHILKVYTDIMPLISMLKGETRRKRTLQLYFDLSYLRILINSSKNISLIEKLDPLTTDLATKYEQMLDSIELYTISAALHSNVMLSSQSTIRLYGLLIPHLQ